MWETLSGREKKDITATLARYFTELRQLPSPNYFGALDKRPLLGGMFWTSKPNPAINGPFDKESDLNEAFALKYSVGYTVGSETEFPQGKLLLSSPIQRVSKSFAEVHPR